MQRATIDRILLAIVVTATIAFVFPIARLGFIDDDALNSYLNGWIGWHHTTWWTFYASVVRQWIVNEGRFMPLNLADGYALFHFTQNAFVVKCVQIALIALNVMTFAVLGSRLTGKRTFGLLCATCVALTLQVRFPIDPIAGFAPLLPATMEFLLLGIVFQLEWQAKRRGMWLIFAVVAFTFAALSYEITYLFVLLFWFLAYRRTAARKAKLWECAAFALPLVVLVGASLVLRHSANLVSNDPYALVLSPSALLRTYAIQTLAAIPFTYALFDPIHFIGALSGALLVRPVAALILGSVFTVLAYALLKRSVSDAKQFVSRRHYVDAVGLGALIWLLSGPMMAASPRWQRDLTFGQSYLPVYFEYFGIALLIAAVTSIIVQRLPRIRTAVIAAACIGVFTGVTYQLNRASERAFLPIWTEGRFALEEAARDGLFAQIPDGATIILDHSYVWDFEPPEPLPNSNIRYLFYQLIGKRDTFLSIDNVGTQLCPGPAATTYCDLRGRNMYAYFSSNETLVPGERWTRTVRVDGALTNGDGTATMLSSAGSIEARGAPAAALTSDTGAFFLTSRKAIGNSTIASAHSCTAVAAADFPSRSGVIFGPGFYGEERNAHETFRWSMRNSQMSIVSPISVTSLHLEGRLASYVSGTKVRIAIPHRATMTVALTAAGTPFSIDASVKTAVPFSITFTLEGKPFTRPADTHDTREFGFRVIDLFSNQSCSTIQ